MRVGFRYSRSPLAALIFSLKEDYIFYNHRLLYVMGLAFSHYLTDFAFTSILVLYFTDYGGDLATSAIFSSIESSLASFSVILLGHAAASYVGKFQTLLFSTTAYIGGLMLFWMFNPYDELWLVVAALVLLALGRAGHNILEVTLVDLLDNIDKSEDNLNSTRSIKRAEIWLVIATIFATISAVLWVVPGALLWVHLSWRSSPLICATTMTITLVIFCTGHNVYSKDEFTQRATGIIFRVFLVRVKKLLKECNSWHNNLNRNILYVLRNTSGQDKAPLNTEIEMTVSEQITANRSRMHSDTNRNEDRGSSSYTEDVVIIKSLLRMFPMWGTFLVVSIISETGRNFFFQQYSNLNTDEEVVVQLYSFVLGSSNYLIPYLYRLVCGRLWIRHLHEKETVKIGVGMVFGFISCVLAWQLEVYRLQKVKYLTPNDTNTSISYLLLVPQFCMLGCMEGLTEVGFEKLYESQVIEEPIKWYGKEYIEIVRGSGSLINIIIIFLFKSQLGWFGNTINDSRVDKYYKVLTCVSSANFIIYCCIAKYFYKLG